MNRSYSKIRHIQEMNQRMDNKLIEEKITNSSIGFISEQGEKKTFLNLLEKQRLIEEQLKYGGTKNFILEQEVKVENEDLSDMPNLKTEKDYNEMINLYPEEFQEFLELLAKKVESSSETNQPGDLNESTLDYGKINILLENCRIGSGDIGKLPLAINPLPIGGLGPEEPSPLPMGFVSVGFASVSK